MSPASPLWAKRPSLRRARRKRFGGAIGTGGTGAGGSSTGRTVKEALYVLRNRVTRDTGSGTLTVYQTDDTTASWTAVQTTSDSAEPIVEVNPA